MKIISIDRANTFANNRFVLGSISLVTLTLLLWSWHQWADILVDSGYNLYLTWQVSQGKILYRDLAYYHGPFSPLFNALVFWVFGPSIQIIALMNTCCVLAMAVLSYQVNRRVFEPVSAYIATMFLLVVFAFSQQTITANYNYAFPYKPEATHGSLFAFILLFSLSRFSQRPKIIFIFAAGLAAGLCLLTSFDLALASLVSLVLGASLLLIDAKKNGKIVNIRGSVLAVGFGYALPPAAAFIFLQNFLSSSDALRATLRSVLFPLEHPSVGKGIFYQNLSGLNAPLENLAPILLSITFFLLLVLMVSLTEQKAKLHSIKLRAILGILSAIVFIIFVEKALHEEWLAASPRIVPAWILLCGFAAFWQLAKQWKERLCFNDEAFRLAYLAFCFLLLGKILLRPRLDYYGFYLAMPASVFCVASLCRDLPLWLQHRGYSDRAVRIAVMVLVAFVAAMSFEKSAKNYADKTFLVGRGGDAIATWDPALSDQGPITQAALFWIERNVPAGSKLLMIPEGNILNYLSRRDSSGPNTLNPLEVIAEGEAKILAHWQNSRPEFIGLITRDASDYGWRTFGQGEEHGLLTLEWVRNNYEKVQQFGAEPFSQDRFGIQFLQRKTLPLEQALER